jgi:hypothetical protein
MEEVFKYSKIMGDTVKETRGQPINGALKQAVS